MFKGKSLKKFFLASAVLMIGASALSGCTSKFVKATKKFEDSAVNALNRSEIVQEALDVDFNDFAFLGADFTRADSNNFDVDVSGVAKYNDGKNNAVVTMSYTLDDDYFEDIKPEKQDKLMESLNKAIETEEISSFDYMEIESFANLNSMLQKFANSPKEDFNFKEGLIFSLGNLSFNEKDGVISFDLKNHNTYVKQIITTTYYYNVALKMLMPMTNTYYEYENCLHYNQVNLFVSPEEMQNMKKDPKSIINTFINHLENNAKDKYKIVFKNTENLNENDLSNIEDFEFENC